MSENNPAIKVDTKKMLRPTENCTATCKAYFSVGGVTNMELRYYDEIL